MRVYQKISLLAGLFIICPFVLSAQSFWKLSGKETTKSALHSAIAYSPAIKALFVATYNEGIFRSTDEGMNWDHVLDLPKD